MSLGIIMVFEDFVTFFELCYRVSRLNFLFFLNTHERFLKGTRLGARERLRSLRFSLA